MNRRFFFTTGTIGAFALFVAVNTVDVQAQRGAGIGHASAPTQVGQGRPATAGRPDTAGRPAGATGRPTTTSGKPDSAGRPTIADQLSRNHGLATQLQKLFPGGTIPDGATDGFTNLGQFVAAVHVAANNPNFTFEELTAKMHDGDGMSLGAAIHELDPHADAETEVETAQTQAAADLKAAGKNK
jgi:hypothetical protein